MVVVSNPITPLRQKTQGLAAQYRERATGIDSYYKDNIIKNPSFSLTSQDPEHLKIINFTKDNTKEYGTYRSQYDDALRRADYYDALDRKYAEEESKYSSGNTPFLTGNASSNPTIGGAAYRLKEIINKQGVRQNEALNLARLSLRESAKKLRSGLALEEANAQGAAAAGYGLKGGTFAQQQAAVNTVKDQGFAKQLQLEGQTQQAMSNLAGQQAQMEAQLGGQAMNVVAQTELQPALTQQAANVQVAATKAQADLYKQRTTTTPATNTAAQVLKDGGINPAAQITKVDLIKPSSPTVIL